MEKKIFKTGFKKMYRIGEYKIKKKIGSGSFSNVYSGILSSDENQEVAIKSIDKNLIKKSHLVFKCINREIKINKLFTFNKHPNILECKKIAQSKNHLYLIFDLCKGGDLLDYLIKKGSLPENEIRPLFKQIVRAVDWCHRHAVAHRDIKPDNILFVDEDKTRIVLSDFGLSCVGDFTRSFEDSGTDEDFALCDLKTKIDDHKDLMLLPPSSDSSSCSVSSDGKESSSSKKLIDINTSISKVPFFEIKNPKIISKTLCGTKAYVAPELLNIIEDTQRKHKVTTHKYIYDATKADIWSLGVTLYVMVFNHIPKNVNDIYNNIERIDSKKYSSEFIDLLNKILDYDPMRRLTADEILRHPFFH